MGEVLREDQYQQWDDFVEQAKGGTVFHKTWYLRALTEELQVHVLRDKGGAIEAGMAITPLRFLGTRAARRPGWTAYNGPLIRPSRRKNAVEAVSDEKNLLVRLLAESPSLGMWDYVLPPEYVDLMPFLWNGFDTTVGYTYQIPPAPPQQWQAAMSSDHRRELRKAGEVLKSIDGAVDTTDDLEFCYNLLCDTFREKEISDSAGPESTRRWWKVVSEHQAGKIYYVKDKDGSPLCCTLYVFDKACGYYVASGIHRDVRRGNLNLLSRLLIERMILDSHARGITFDFEGSVLPGVEHFFRGWGGRCVPKYRVIKISRWWTYVGWCLYHYRLRHRRRTWFEV